MIPKKSKAITDGEVDTDRTYSSTFPKSHPAKATIIIPKENKEERVENR